MPPYKNIYCVKIDEKQWQVQTLALQYNSRRVVSLDLKANMGILIKQTHDCIYKIESMMNKGIFEILSA